MAEVGLDIGVPQDGASTSMAANAGGSDSPASSPDVEAREVPGSLPPGRLSRGVSQSLPDVSGVGLSSFCQPPRALPTATFTPTAAGLREATGPAAAAPLDFQSFFSSAFSSFLAAGLQQASQMSLQPLAGQAVQQAPPSASSRPSKNVTSVDLAESDPGDECPEDFELSDDDELPPDNPAFTGLFRPAMFKSLLHKARLTTNLGAAGTDTAGDSAAAGPHDALFHPSKPDKDVVPCPRLFLEVLQNPWGQPGSLTSPSSLDKKLYCASPELDDLLVLPTVDAPVAALASGSSLPTDSLDGLKAEDRRSELAFCKSHQAITWAIKTATANSFFTRASLIWLKQLQQRLPPEEKRLHQDINKIVAATEYSADASLNSVKFASRALASTVSARRLFWLRQWKADLKSKWRLASAPFKAPNLFGAALDPVLIEDRDKRKVLPTSFRRSDRRYTPYSQRQSFRPYSATPGSSFRRPSFSGGDRAQGRDSFRDRGRFQQPAKRPYRSSNFKQSRRGK